MARGKHLNLPRGSQVENCSWIVEFFNFMTAASNDRPFGIPIPETVVFKYHRPIAWFRYNHETRSVELANNGNVNALTATQIFASMVRPPAKIRQPPKGSSSPARPSCHGPKRVVANYVTSRRDRGANIPSVEYFDEEGLREFLFERWKRKPPEDGILQRFVEPGIGDEFNSNIRVLWTPYICSMERCTNVNYLHDDKIPASTRAATFDAPAHVSECIPIRGGRATSKLLHVTTHVLTQLRRLLPTHEVAEAVFFLKLQADGQVWIQWCHSLRLVSTEAAHHMKMGAARWQASPRRPSTTGLPAEREKAPTTWAEAGKELAPIEDLPKLTFRNGFWVADSEHPQTEEAEAEMKARDRMLITLSLTLALILTLTLNPSPRPNPNPTPTPHPTPHPHPTAHRSPLTSHLSPSPSPQPQP